MLLTVNYYIRHTKHSAKHLADKHQSIVLAISIICASLKLKSFLCGFKKSLLGRRPKIKEPSQSKASKGTDLTALERKWGT